MESTIIHISQIPLGSWLGILAFFLHLIAYGIYSYHLLRGKIKPNAITWFMWLFGGIIEYVTYDHLMGSHWSTSALPLACVLGISTIFLITIFLQTRAFLRNKNEARKIYHKPEKSDYYLTSFDAVAGIIWVIYGAATYANILAVSTSVVTFIPIWRTTIKEGEEHPTPWIIWSMAYLCMFFAVLLDRGEGVYARLFYPAYYLLLHVSMALLASNSIRMEVSKRIVYFQRKN